MSSPSKSTRPWLVVTRDDIQQRGFVRAAGADQSSNGTYAQA